MSIENRIAELEYWRASLDKDAEIDRLKGVVKTWERLNEIYATENLDLRLKLEKMKSRVHR